MNEEEKYYYEHQNLRKKIYMDAWTAVAGVFNSKIEHPKKWAERALKEFDEQFPMPAFPLQQPYPISPYPFAPYPYNPFQITSAEGQYDKYFSSECKIDSPANEAYKGLWEQSLRDTTVTPNDIHICTPPYFMSGFGTGRSFNTVTAEDNIFKPTKKEE